MLGRKNKEKNISNLFPVQSHASTVDISCRCASYVWIQIPMPHSFQSYRHWQSQSQNSSFKFPTAPMSFTLTQMISISLIPRHQQHSHRAEHSVKLGKRGFPKILHDIWGMHSVHVYLPSISLSSGQHKQSPKSCCCHSLQRAVFFLLCRASAWESKPLSRCRPMFLVKKTPPSPSISKVCAHNKELLCIGRGWGKAGGHLFDVVKTYKGIG